LSVPRNSLRLEVKMEKENKKPIGWITALVLGIFTWFLGGIVSAGTGLKQRH